MLRSRLDVGVVLAKLQGTDAGHTRRGEIGIQNELILELVGFDSKKILSLLDKYKIKNINVVYNNNYLTENTGAALLSCLHHINNRTIVFDDGIISRHIVKQDISYLPIIKKSSDETFNIGATGDFNKIEYLFYDLPNRWAEHISVSSSDIDRVKSILLDNQDRVKNMFLFEIVNMLIDNNIIFENYIIGSKDAQKIMTYKKAKK